MSPAQSGSRARRPSCGRRRPTNTCRSPSTGSSATCRRSRWSAPTARSTGTAARASTRRASSPRSSTRQRGGYYRIAPDDARVRTEAALLPGHERPDHALPHADGVGEVQDFMPIRHAGRQPTAHRLIRRVLVRPRRDALPRRGRAALRLRARRARRSSVHEHGARLPRRATLTLGARDRPCRSSSSERRRRVRVHARRPARAATFVLEQVPETRAAAATPSDETREAFEGHGRLLAALARAVPLPGPLARDGRTARR